jgi:MFS superfamily sulfate permease-like transporter
MATVKTLILRIEKEMGFGAAKVPEEMLTELIEQVGYQELKDWEIDIQRLISQFVPKRKKRLEELLTECLYPHKQLQKDSLSEQEFWPIEDLIKEFKNELKELSEKHIFQWATAYPEILSNYFEEFVKWNPPNQIFINNADNLLRQCIAEHSAEIFSKGFDLPPLNRSMLKERIFGTLSV